MISNYITTLSILFLMIGNVCGDYSCLCSYQIELEIFEKPDTSSNVDGYMYEFDCKPFYKVPNLDPTFAAVGNEGKLGYVQKSSNVQVQTCQGSVPDIDRVKTTPPAATTATTTTTSLPITQSTQIQIGNITTATSIPLQTSPISTLIVQATKTTTDSTQGMSNKTGTTTIRNTSTTISTLPMTSNRLTSPMTTTIHITAPPSTTTTSSTTTSSPLPQYSCPLAVQQNATTQNIFQHGTICYEVVPTKGNWMEAKNDCRSKNGHLVSIANADQQKFVTSILERVNINSPVWLGLYDGVNEEEWHLDTGAIANYTNWYPGRFIDQYHDQEDCGLMIPANKHRWDDVNCNGATYGKYYDYHWICQYW